MVEFNMEGIFSPSCQPCMNELKRLYNICRKGQKAYIRINCDSSGFLHIEKVTEKTVYPEKKGDI